MALQVASTPDYPPLGFEGAQSSWKQQVFGRGMRKPRLGKVPLGGFFQAGLWRRSSVMLADWHEQVGEIPLVTRDGSVLVDVDRGWVCGGANNRGA